MPPPDWGHHNVNVRVTSVEFTRKWIKILKMLALVMYFGMMFCTSTPKFEAMLGFGALILFFVACVSQWWYHD
jgi:hypothetical protein